MTQLMTRRMAIFIIVEDIYIDNNILNNQTVDCDSMYSKNSLLIYHRYTSTGTSVWHSFTFRWLSPSIVSGTVTIEQ